MAAIRREQEEAEVRECSFRPVINAKSARMVEQRQQILKVGGGCGGRCCVCVRLGSGCSRLRVLAAPLHPQKWLIRAPPQSHIRT